MNIYNLYFYVEFSITWLDIEFMKQLGEVREEVCKKKNAWDILISYAY